MLRGMRGGACRKDDGWQHSKDDDKKGWHEDQGWQRSNGDDENAGLMNAGRGDDDDDMEGLSADQILASLSPMRR